MNHQATKPSTLEKDKELSPRVALWFSMMQEVRQRLLKKLEPLGDEEIDYTPDDQKIETIGTLLLHIAGVEWSWIFGDIDGKEVEYEKWKHAFALAPDMNIPQLRGQRKDFYLKRLSEVRKEVYQRLKQFQDDDLDKLVTSEGKKHSIEWILFHLVEHEAIHVGQVSVLSRLYRKKSES
ncbi:MAG: DinB family protein [Promethearchaeota archaeon]